jgi:hypothetical protein
MSWWPPWRREEPEVRTVERSGEKVRRAEAQTNRMGEEIRAQDEEVHEAAEGLAEIIMRSMRGGR